jgi:simple sugar transport system permease protein
MADVTNLNATAIQGRAGENEIRGRTRLTDFVIKYGMLVAIAILISFFATQNDAFLTLNNLMLIARAVSILVIVAIGVTISVSVDGFDVSVGAVTGLSVLLSTSLMVIWNVDWLVAILLTLGVGVIIGLINSFFILKLRIPDLLATLGMLYLAQGFQLMLTQGEAVFKGMFNPWTIEQVQTTGEIAPAFKQIGQGFIGGGQGFSGIPIPVILMLVIAIGAHIFLQYTRWGRLFYAVGGNREAARLSGIPVQRVRLAAYVLSALLASVAGLVLASRIGSGAIRAGDPYLLDAVAATFFGFAVLGARRPNVFGTVIGALFVGILLNGLTMMNVEWFFQDFIKGGVLIASLAMSFFLVKRNQPD